jgi:hypothetical protein
MVRIPHLWVASLARFLARILCLTYAQNVGSSTVNSGGQQVEQQEGSEINKGTPTG